MSTPVERLSRDERVQRGKAARTALPLDALADTGPTDGRPDPLDLLEQQATIRVPELIPLRYGRMSDSAFAFYRGSALVMAHDLATTPDTGLRVQLCGDAHLSNFGVFGSPERRLLFDLNDFDETLPGPFEWDVKRLLASVELAGRANDFSRKERRQAVLGAARAYREAVREFAGQASLAVWYAHASVDDMIDELLTSLPGRSVRRTRATISKARSSDHLKAVGKLTELVDGRRRFVADPPLLVPLRDLMDENHAALRFHDLLVAYRTSLQDDRRHLLEQYRLVDMARKVVGVGSVGTRAWVILLQGTDENDLIVLQAKEAQASVLEEFAGASDYGNHAQRVVEGQRLMQAASDIFLGWQRVTGVDDVERDFYVRQLRDWKGSLPVEEAIPAGMARYAELCGWSLARAHSRSGDRVAIAAYLGSSERADEALTEYAVGYADRIEGDHTRLVEAIDSGRLPATKGV
ncbi:DUF2252 domain-containing protein [Cellulomonas sp.]|uniref:DUF2252 domain-containing protein n=1 Tax=Cellulomonas sp. TaxID=40001 RepID=UPI001B2CF291|nr:DUF2252 domain-containing protein [Cellulomonas sp.]MBO9553526.1 DUF2252 domain-containing protein [Cellulomonas sp.]